MNADIAIVGSGFAGSLLAMIARRLGHSVVLLERGRHPRFAIGESTTPLTNLLLEELAAHYGLSTVLPLSKWGTWQRSCPNLACGLKRGFTFYHHRFDQPFVDDLEHRQQLLVAASPRDEVADTHWFRADFDEFLVRQAQALGVEFLDDVEMQSARIAKDGVLLSGQRRGGAMTVQARFVVDASGPRGFLQRALHLPEVPLEKMPRTQGLYTHFSGVRRWMEICPDRAQPPYPVDDAALHHVFEGGWIWVLRFNNGVVSAGVAATDELAKDLNLREGAAAWDRLLGRLPTVQAQFAAAKAEREFVHAPRLSFLSGSVVDRNWALLPSAAGFVDPLLSTGFPLTLLGLRRLARILERDWGSDRLVPHLFDYSMRTTMELATAARLVGALYAAMNDFELFAALSLLYFAAASFTETAWRLGRPELAGEAFLLGEHPVFGPRFRYCVDCALGNPSGAGRQQLIERIYETIAPVDIAGLGDRSRRNWHPAQVADLLRAAPKLGASEDEIRALVERCGLSERA